MAARSLGLAAFALLQFGSCALAQTNPAMNAPDQVAWQLFLQVTAKTAGTSALFETWASDTDTFKVDPKFPTEKAPMVLRPPVVPAFGREIAKQVGLVPAVPPNPQLSEETRRNKAAFDFIVKNNLYKASGLRAAFGKTLAFPVDAIEVKANWLPVNAVPAFTNGRVMAADVEKLYHVNTNTDGKQYALISLHVISKLVPNWTWATFEHRLNPARCDVIGCRDAFGAQAPVVRPNPQPNSGYPDCAKTQALSALFGSAGVDAVFINYCLKGSQADFIDSEGLDVRLGNSVTEDGFVNRSSCMTCHGRAGFDAKGQGTPNAGFDSDGAPLGRIETSWYWRFTAKPPIFEGMPGLQRVSTSADFVWSIPFCAIDDSKNPPFSPCQGK